MKRTLTAVMMSLALAAGAAPAFAHGQSSGKSMKMSELPAPVRDTLRNESQSGRVEEIRESTDHNGNKEYKAEVVSGSKGTDLTISPDGNVTNRRSHNEAAEHKEGNE